MKEIIELKFDESVKYSKEHTWAKTDGHLIVIGISDYAQDHLGEIIFIDLPEIWDSFNRNAEFGVVESAKSTSELYMPVGGEVVEVNDTLRDNPEIVNSDPFTAGWMIKVLPKDTSELSQLFSAEGYKASLT